MNTLRNVVLWVMMVMGVAGCREASSVAPDTSSIRIERITTEVWPGKPLTIEGTNLDRLSGSGQIVFYDRQNVRIPIRLVFGSTAVTCTVPVAVRSGRVKIVGGDGRVVVDTVLRVYGDYRWMTGMPQGLIWNQRLDGRMAGLSLLDTRGNGLSFVQDQFDPDIRTVPHGTGEYCWVIYDSTARLYHPTRTSVVIRRPVIELGKIGETPSAIVNHYEQKAGETIRLRSANDVYDRKVLSTEDAVGVSLSGMRAGRYRAEVVNGSVAEAIDGEIIVNVQIPDAGETFATPFRIDLSIGVTARVTEVRTDRYGDTHIDTSTKPVGIDMRYLFERCVIHRISQNSYSVAGQYDLGGMRYYRLSGTLIVDERTISTNLQLHGDGVSYDRPDRRHYIALKKRPYVRLDDGSLEVRIDGVDLVRSGEYGYTYEESGGHNAYSYRITESPIAGSATGRVLLALDLGR